jgi:competence protein ComEC
VRDQFQATGTVHVLVTAGLHLGVIAGLVLGLLRLSRAPRIAASLAAIPCVVAYAWLSGAHLPSQRAAAMVSVALLARACGARLASWNALALAALVVAALWPASVTSVSFALSFSCVGAILLFAGPLGHALERWALPDRVREALALTIATQIGVWPLSAATFGLVAPYAVLANAIVVPATAVGMLAGIGTLVCAAIPVLGRATATIATWDVDAILRVVGAVAALPGAHVRVAPPPAIAIAAYDAAAVAAALMLRRDVRVACALLVLAGVGVLATTLRPPDGRLTITMLDVGQGDGIVIRTPRGHTILIDSGGRLERGPVFDGKSPAELVGERVVLAYLLREGIRTIDLMVNTHPHGDHVGGCFPIVNALRVDAIGDSGQDYGGRAFRDCLAAAHARRVPVVLVRKGMHYATGDGVAFDALAPEEPLLAEGRNDVNENSIVLMMTYRCARCMQPFRMLFTGDAGAQTEARMLTSRSDVRADVLKVGHHGSAYSSTPAFVAAVHPHVALISVGRHNLFGHPAPTTLAALSTAGVTIYRTDACGAIIVESNPQVRVNTTLQCFFDR